MRLTPVCLCTGFCDQGVADGRALTSRVTGKRRRPTRIALALLVWIGVATAVAGQLDQAQAETFGKTTVGASTDNGMFANYKIVHKATLSVPGTVTKLSLYAVPGVNSPAAQSVKAVIYADSEGSPGKLLATGSEVTYKGNVNGSGWLELPLASPVELNPGTYWIGFIDGSETEGMGYKYDELSNSRAYNTNTYSSGPTNPFGTTTKDSEQASIYATYTPTPEFGKTGVGAHNDNGMFANYKIVHKATMSAPGAVTKLSLYAIPGINSPSGQSLKAVIYSDSEGSPSELLATGTEVTYKGNVNGSGWFELPFASPVKLMTATYWIGFIDGSETEGMGYVYDEVANSRAYNTNSFSSGPTSTFGTMTKDSEQASIFATYTPAPENTSAPTITGTVKQGHTLTEHHGSWSGEPTSYSYQWQQCNTLGESCLPISGATGQTYVPVVGDVGHTLKVQEKATNASGTGEPATSAATAEVTSATCTDTFTATEGAWQTGADWSKGTPPSSTDVACIGSGKTAEVISGAKEEVGVVEGEGTIKIRETTLEVAGSEPSQIKKLIVDYAGKLTGNATFQVNGTFTWSGGEMSGSGSTVLLPGATGTLEASVTLKKRTLVNEGTLTFLREIRYLTLEEGAEFDNPGTFTDNTEGDIDTGSGAAPKILNTGTWHRTEGTSETAVEPEFDNEGTVSAGTGKLDFRGGGTSGASHAGTWKGNGGEVALREGTFKLGATAAMEGTIVLSKYAVSVPKVSVGKIEGPAAQLTVNDASLTLEGPGASAVENLTVQGSSGALAGAGTVEVSKSFEVCAGVLSGSGSIVLKSGGTGSIECGPRFAKRSLINEGTIIFPREYIEMEEGAEIVNRGVFNASSQGVGLGSESEGKPTGKFVNTGVFEKTEGTGTTVVFAEFYNYGEIVAKTGKFEFKYPAASEPQELGWGSENPSSNGPEPSECGEGVDCATGNYSQTQTDFHIGGRGVGLDLTRTYNSQAAAQGTKGAFGYGWSGSFSDSLSVNKTSKRTTLHQANGSSVTFTEGSGGSFAAPEWTQDTLSGSEGSGYTLTLPDQTVYKFSGSSGRLESVTDRNGNATTLTYNEAGRLTTITDPASRTIKLTYNGEGLVENAEDPMKHVVKYTYASGNLKSATQPGEAGLRWQYKYDGSHQLTELTDGRSNTSINEYNAKHEVVKQTDPLKRETSFEYEPFFTKTTNKATGAVTREQFSSNNQPLELTRGYGTSSATTEARRYDSAHDLTSATDGNGHTTRYAYDGHANRVSMTDPLEHETKWTYDSTHDVETETKPNGEKTTYKRDSHGNPEVIERPAPAGKTQTTKYKYDGHGNVETMTDPLERTWKYEYDGQGDKTAETDAEGDKRTWGYNEDSQETSTVSPKGHVEGAKEAEYETATERDAQGRPKKVTDPLGHETTYKYDANGNLEAKIDPEGHETVYTYDADNEQTKIKEPTGTVTETGYDGAGEVTSHTDGNKHTTKYERNVLEQVTEVIDPLSRKTTKEYDLAGNLTKLTDALERATTYKYNAANQLEEVSYSDGKTHAVKYEYNKDGDRTKMVDGTGTTTYEYDELDRLTEAKDGHGDVVKYEYDLANQQTKVTYPNGKAVNQEFDNAGRLKKVTDWSERATKFGYDANSNLKSTTFPTGTTNEDTYEYDATDAMKEVKMVKGAETLASLVFTRNKNGDVEGATSKGLPGEEKPAYTYDASRRLKTAGATAYKYDEADNPTEIGALTYSYDNADELEKAKEGGTTKATYKYDEVGQRKKTKPGTGPETTYGYDQAGNLTSVERPKEGEVAQIEDAYAYNGDGLRMSQTISKTTTYMAWDTSGDLPLILNDGTNSYVYGPGGLPIEQINSEGKVIYLHHDQQGSTRLLTNATGSTEATFTYDAYGAQTGHTGAAATALGYGGQYTDSDTGLIYLRARYYDPSTAQFVSVDPDAFQTGTAYGYSGEDPVNADDPTGKRPEGPQSCRNQVVVREGHGTLRHTDCLGTLTVNYKTRKCGAYGCEVDYTAYGAAPGTVHRGKQPTLQVTISEYNPAWPAPEEIEAHPRVDNIITPHYGEYGRFIPYNTSLIVELHLKVGRAEETLDVTLTALETEIEY